MCYTTWSVRKQVTTGILDVLVKFWHFIVVTLNLLQTIVQQTNDKNCEENESMQAHRQANPCDILKDAKHS